MMRARLLLLIALLTAAAAVAARRADRDTPQPPALSRRAATDLFLQTAALVRDRAASPLTEEELIDGSLEGMLSRLDPHSGYYGPEVYKELLEDQEGKFHGLGMLVTKPSPSAPLLVVSPIPDTPAARAGLRAGDVILEIDQQPTAKMQTREAVRKLKGPAGTAVTLTVGRGSSPPQSYTLKRAPIPKHTVPFSFLLEEGIGYVKVNTFGQTTVDELKGHLQDLVRDGARSFVLDLRDNPGGSLPAAIGVASLFLKDGQEVVSVRGRRLGQVRRFVAEDEGPYVALPLVVLVNRSSASASEIVAGALQDHDRATVLGERTWGKGLVQTVTPLERGAAAITTARYYTPSGRSIQRDYSRSRDAYYFPDQQPEGMAAAGASAGAAANTDAGRTVFGGGGIAPDTAVEPGKIPELGIRLEQHRAYLDFVSRKIESGLTAQRVSSPEFLAEFKAGLQDEHFTDAEWAASEDYSRKALVREFRTMTQGQGEAYQAMAPLDLPLQKAAELLRPAAAKKAA